MLETVRIRGPKLFRHVFIATYLGTYVISDMKVKKMMHFGSPLCMKIKCICKAFLFTIRHIFTSDQYIHVYAFIFMYASMHEVAYTVLRESKLSPSPRTFLFGSFLYSITHPADETIKFS